MVSDLFGDIIKGIILRIFPGIMWSFFREVASQSHIQTLLVDSYNKQGILLTNSTPGQKEEHDSIWMLYINNNDTISNTKLPKVSNRLDSPIICIFIYSK